MGNGDSALAEAGSLFFLFSGLSLISVSSGLENNFEKVL